MSWLDNIASWTGLGSADQAQDAWGGMRQTGAMGSGTASAQAPTSMGITPGTSKTPFGSMGLGFNVDTLSLGLSGISALSSAWNSYEQQKLAKKTFNYQKDVSETNLRNQIQTINTSIADRQRARAYTEGAQAQDSEQYIKDNSLHR